MVKIVYISVILFAIGIAYISKSSTGKFTIPEDNFWWGPGEPTKQDTSIRPFNIQVPNEVLEDLKWRLDHTRLQTPPLENIHFQYGFNSDTLKKIIEFWRLEYKWRERESYLNKYPQFKTQIQGLDIHFIHIKPQIRGNIKRTVPLLLLHGWPGSVREFYELVPLLTERPVAGTDFVFELVIPSLPGYLFSQGAARPGLGNAECAIVFKNLMKRLGYQKYYVQGGDWGSQVASHMGLFFPDKVLGLHLNLCACLSVTTIIKVALGSLVPWLVVDNKDYTRMYPLSDHFTGKFLMETGYLHLQATKPDTIGIGLQDSPAGLAAYILEKFSTGTNVTYRNIKDGGLTEKYTYTDLLDNVMLYWVTGSITTSVRLYAENYSKKERALGLDEAAVNVPLWCSKYQFEILWFPDWLLRSRYPKLVRSMQHDFGGHFAALENPKSLAEDIWSALAEGEEMLKRL